MKPMYHLSESKGFTLVEVLVALLILTLALVALQVRMGRYLEDAAYLRDKTLASWVAMNQLELLRLAQRLDLPANPQQQSGSVEMMQRRWYWFMQPEELPVQMTSNVSPVMLVHVQVSPVDADAAIASPLSSITGVSRNAP